MQHNIRKNIENQKQERLGLEKLNKQGSLMKIIEYNNATNVTIKFLDEYGLVIKNRTWEQFKCGSIINPYFKSVYGVGFLGYKYPAKVNGQHTMEYKMWHSMFVRCYSDLSNKIRPTYDNVFVNKQWHNYENFYEWVHTQSNFERFTYQDMCELDKDILIKHNKEYSPQKCFLVPHNVNALFTRRERCRGRYPIGVHLSENNRYIAQCNNPKIGRQEYLGVYTNPEDAFYSYKQYKEKVIKEVAYEEFCKGRITKECFEAMNNYNVEITD